jgi:hypothetical protein
MKNKKLLFPAVIPSLFIMIYFIVTGFKTMNRYADTPGDWHFIAALVGVTGFLLLFMVLGYRLIRKPIKD